VAPGPSKRGEKIIVKIKAPPKKTIKKTPKKKPGKDETVPELQKVVRGLRREKLEMAKTIAELQKADLRKVAAANQEIAQMAERAEMAKKDLAALQEETAAKETKVKEVKETLERALECICCFLIPNKIHQCTRGHIICEACQLKVPKKPFHVFKACPTCGTRLLEGEPIRNLLAEYVASTMNVEPPIIIDID